MRDRVRGDVDIIPESPTERFIPVGSDGFSRYREACYRTRHKWASFIRQSEWYRGVILRLFCVIDVKFAQRGLFVYIQIDTVPKSILQVKNTE